MAIRSIVAMRTTEGIKGVYVHFDGHPDTRLPTLRALIARDGATKVIDTILGKPHGWLLFDETQTDEPLNDDDVTPIAGYGQQWTGDFAEDHYRTPAIGELDDVDYIYILGPGGSIAWAATIYAASYDALHWHTDKPQAQ